jgi:hypothetical protein
MINRTSSPEEYEPAPDAILASLQELTALA